MHHPPSIPTGVHHERPLSSPNVACAATPMSPGMDETDDERRETEALRAEIASLREQLNSLRASGTRYRVLTDLTTDAAYELKMNPETDPATVSLTWATASMARLLNRTQGDLLEAGDWLNCVHPADRPMVQRHREHLAQGSRMITEYRIQTPEMERWVCDYSQPLRGKGGVRRIHGAIREITHERRYDRVMRANREKYKHIFNNSPLGIFHFDADGTITQCNDNFIEIIGSSRSDLLGLNVLTDLKDEDLIAAVRQALEHGDARYKGDYASVTADKVTPVRVLFNSIRAVSGKPMGGVGIVEDVTQRREYEHELIRARDEAEKMNRLKSAFLANMSHEIRTPLTAIIGFADILTEELPSTHRQLPQIIEQSGTRLLNTLNSVLDLSMLESGEMQMNIKLLDVTTHVAENVELMQPLALNKDLSLRIETPDTPRFAHLDSGALDRILSNLIGNAIKFTETGSVTVRVSDTAWTPEGKQEPQPGLRIDVEDTGIGISEAFLPDLFDVFKQESAGLQRSHEGSGLGLAITRHLVDQLDGTITVDSEKGIGSTFSVTFPIEETPDALPVETPSSIHRHQQGRRVLVVEDTPETQVLVERILSSYHDVDLVETADAALQAAQGRRVLGEPAYDVILLDINLDGTASGLDLLPQLRQLPNYARMPIIATTAFALSGDRDRFLDAGFDAYVSKPFTRNQILDVIDQVLGERE